MHYILAEFQDFIFIIIVVLVAIFNGIKSITEKFKEANKQTSENQVMNASEKMPSLSEPIEDETKPKGIFGDRQKTKESTQDRAVALAKQTAYEQQRASLRTKQHQHQQSLQVDRNNQAESSAIPPKKPVTISAKKSKAQHASVHHNAKSKIIAHQQMAHHQMAKKAVAKHALKRELNAKKVAHPKRNALLKLLKNKSPLASGILYAEILNKPKALQTNTSLWS